MLIRKATIGDIEQLEKLWQGQFAFHHQLDPEYFVPVNEKTISNIRTHLHETLQKNDRANFVAESGSGEIVGFIYCSAENDGYIDTNLVEYGFIWEVFVSPGARENGVGRMLLKKAEEFLQQLDLTHVKLFISTANQRVIPFYEETGYRQQMIGFLKKL